MSWSLTKSYIKYIQLKVANLANSVIDLQLNLRHTAYVHITQKDTKNTCNCVIISSQMSEKGTISLRVKCITSISKYVDHEEYLINDLKSLFYDL